jgi:PAT family beta-lactamase induction signal transducer AmpG
MCGKPDALIAGCPHLLADKGWIDGFASTLISIVAGIAGGLFVSKYGLSNKMLVGMAFCINIPNLTFVFLSQSTSVESPVALSTILTLVTIEKAGYSFGFVANMLYMMQQISPGKYHMTHYAFCTSLMNLVLIPTQMSSGPLADWLGYKSFFIFVIFATIPAFIAAWLAPFPHKGKPSDAKDEQAASAEGGA